MNIVDSSGWLEYFSGGPNADHFLPPLQEPSSLIVPTIIIYEVFKVVLRETDENQAFQSIAAMQKGSVIDLTAGIAINASKLSLQYNLPMADSIILATAKSYECVIWTQDSDFANFEQVKFFPKKNIGQQKY
ncbi:type II toxin-antitoxin system VapC family toxin [Desulfatitalea tepidiphila]|uniref:type II toxin-antitoxin system VapC family toxin n=1 Tax=Desulfatitalea tepidiphila TaxID=1185843 RepID=UPI0006B5A432|nr:type II toxin-antitoxin system VapC family toxin [Desulfatitalea tepidiphila]